MTRQYASLPQMNMPFQGAKLALLTETDVVVLLRDDRPDIPWPNYWDLPGGGREPGETPLDCVIRETQEELALNVCPSWITWGKPFGASDQRTWFFVAGIAPEILEHVRLGNEGQSWRAMNVSTFLQHDRAVPHFQSRLRAYLGDKELDNEKPPASSSGGR